MQPELTPAEPRNTSGPEIVNAMSLGRVIESVRPPEISPSRRTKTAVAVRRYEESSRQAWDNYVERHPSASIFHLTAWKRAVERAFKFRAHYIFAENGGSICGILPLFFAPTFPFGHALISTPLAVYGGVCADDQFIAEQLRKEACALAQHHGVQYLEMREQLPAAHSGFVTKKLYVAFDLELPKSAEKLLSGFPRDTRYMIRKGQKSGLTSIVENSQLDTFYEIYARSFHNLGTPVFSKQMFRIILEEFRDHCELTTVWHEKQALASVLSFRFGDWILPYFGGSLIEGRKLAVNNFMYFEVMRRAIEQGLRHFDFGRSKLGSGSYTFKTQWNMRERELPYQYLLVRRKSMPNFSPANPKFQFATSVWKALPFQLTKLMGPPLVRWFP